MIKRVVGLLLISCFAYLPLAFAEKVVLQLKWEHQFQFAGYYAALWQGYYQDEGLEVEIRSAAKPDGTFIRPIDTIANRTADFAIGGLDILLAEDNGIPVTVLAPIFQRSASAIFSLENQPLKSLADLANLRVATTQGDMTEVEFKALMKSRGYDIEALNIVNQPPTVQSLIDGKADVIVTYAISANFEANEKNVKLNKLDPADFGINFYGDTLYTHQQLYRSNPKLVEKFHQASLEGWQYAINHPEEIAKKIAESLPRHIIKFEDPLAFNLEFSKQIKKLLDFPATPIGSLSEDKWLAMQERVRAIGLVNVAVPSDAFFIKTNTSNAKSYDRFLFFAFVISIISIGLIGWFYRKVWVAIASLIITLIVIQQSVEAILKNDELQAKKFELLQTLSSTTGKLEGILRTNLSMITGFAAYISASPDLSEEEFTAYAKEIFKKDPLLINFASAKDLIINYIYPKQGNEKAIGLDYLKTPSQRAMVVQVVNTGQLLVIGPITLVQGGVAFIGRAPIFTGENNERKLWGIISAPIDAEKLYQRAGFYQIPEDTQIAIKSFDSLGNEGPVFFGNPDVFNNPSAIKQVIVVGGGTWHIGAVKVGTLSELPSNIIIFRLAIFISTLLMCAMMLVRFNQTREKEALQLAITENKNLLEKVGRVAQIGGWKLDEDLNFTKWSEQASVLLDQPKDFAPKNFLELAKFFSPSDFKGLVENIEFLIESGKPFEIELKADNNTGIDNWYRIIADLDVTTQETIVVGTMQNVTEKVKAEQLIRHQATYDSLTGLPNRVLFNDRLATAIQTANRNKTNVAVLFIDLDRFKPINDNYGHQAGDEMLNEAAVRISSCVRKSDTVSRLSGDEFGILLVNFKGFENINNVAKKILAQIQQPHTIDGNDVFISASIGISIYPNDGENSDVLLRKADQAMYEVKKSGRNGWQFYTKEMQEKSEYRHRLLNQLITAVNHNELVPYFQPILDLKAKSIIKCESLARWPRADGSFVPPSKFIAIAEESGLVNSIDLAMLNAASSKLVSINQQNGTSIGLSINVSPRLFQTKDQALQKWLAVVEKISQDLAITVEITERLLTDDSDKAFDVLQKLKDLNVKIAIDDFGTGYSSLSYLFKFPVDIIKIDRSFIDGIGETKSAESLIETILTMAEKLNLSVVAEGIETQAQMDFLVQHFCDLGQGYYLAKPMPFNDLQKLINDGPSY